MVGLEVSFSLFFQILLFSFLLMFFCVLTRSRTISAIPGISVNQLNKSCKCLLASLANTATTAVKATTTKTTAKATSAAKATAPACKKRRKNRRTVTVEVSAEATAAF
jgi:hypothetical protein